MQMTHYKEKLLESRLTTLALALALAIEWSNRLGS